MSADYFLEIESHFISRRGTPFVLNPKDYVLMQAWAAAGIPLPIVIEAIDAVFDRFDKKGRRVNGLSFVKDEVKKLWTDRRDMQVGAEAVAPEEDPSGRLEELATLLEPTPAAGYADRVRELAKEKSVPRIEEALMELETALIEELLASAPQLREQAVALAAGADEKSRARSTDAHLRRLVREEFGVPRLTIF